MKKIHIMLCLALGILVSGCFTSYVSTKQMMGIYQGMTQSQVESVLGCLLYTSPSPRDRG